MWTTAILPNVILTLLYQSCWAKVLQVGYIDNPDAVTMQTDANNRTSIKGFAVDLLNWVAANQNFSYELTYVDYSDGFTGFTEYFYGKELDLAMAAFGLTVSRVQVMKALFPWSYTSYTLLIPFPRRQSDPWSCFKPFDSAVWILIMISAVTMAILLKLLATTESQLGAKQDLAGDFQSLKGTSTYVLGVITNQGGYCSSQTRSSRFLAAVWCLAALVLLNAYSGSLITYLTAPKTVPIVNSIEELAKRDEVQLFAFPRGDFVRDLLEASTGELKPLATNLNRVPEDYCGSSRESEEFTRCLHKVQTEGRHVFALVKDEALVLIQDEFVRTGRCDLTLIEQSYFPTYAGFYMSMNASHQDRNSLDVGILKAVSYGLIKKWIEKYNPAKVSNPCLNFRDQTTTTKPIPLTDVESAFVILGLGYGLSLIAFIYEVFKKHLGVKPKA